MKLTLQHGASLLVIDVQPEGSRHRVVVDGREYAVEAHPIDEHTLVLEIGGRRETVHVARAGEDRFAAVGGEIHRFSTDSPALHGDMAALAEPEVRAPMPGKVLQVLVAAGDAVEPGDGLLLLEAMKMENRLTASAKGEVAEVRVAAGDMVSGGQVLVVLRFGAD